jgi:hypothetical protein
MAFSVFESCEVPHLSFFIEQSDGISSLAENLKEVPKFGSSKGIEIKLKRTLRNKD